MPELVQLQKQVHSSQMVVARKPEQASMDRSASLLHADRALGNQALQRMLSSHVIQPKLKIGRPDDDYEGEADRVADQIMRMPDPLKADVASFSYPKGIGIQQACQRCGQKDFRCKPLEKIMEKEVLQTKNAHDINPKVTSALASQINIPQSRGQPLSGSEQDFFGLRFGYDFSRVRIHKDRQSAELAHALNARAFTVGNDLVFGDGQYDPQTSKGKRLIAHELTHAIQQNTHNFMTLMRSCNCSGFEYGRLPTADEVLDFEQDAPRLVYGQYCITGNATDAYNCYAWSVGVTDNFFSNEYINSHFAAGSYSDIQVLTYHGLDLFYHSFGLIPTETTGNPDVLVYGERWPQHAAKLSNFTCDSNYLYESKLGGGMRIAHHPDQLEGSVYGNIRRAYRFEAFDPYRYPRPARRSLFPTMIPYSEPRFPR